MVLMASGRTDIVAFYSKWFMNRYREGFVDVRSPFNPKLVKRIDFSLVDLILFCTKNPLPILPYLNEIKIPILFHITLTPYGKDIEPNVLSKGKIINSIIKISSMLGIENVCVRYDPIFINDKYTIDYHINAFESMCSKLCGYVKHIIVSFLDYYKNVSNNINLINPKKMCEDDYRLIGVSFSRIAKKYGMEVQTCCEENNLVSYGFVKGECLSHSLMFKLTGKTGFKTWKARGKNCKCIQMVDIGSYNSCSHMCRYCYANYEERKVRKNMSLHDPNSTMLIGSLKDDDLIKGDLYEKD